MQLKDNEKAIELVKELQVNAINMSYTETIEALREITSLLDVPELHKKLVEYPDIPEQTVNDEMLLILEAQQAALQEEISSRKYLAGKQDEFRTII